MNRAFTLIECIIVVAIIAIISAIAIPNLIEARDAQQAKQRGEVVIEYNDIVGKTFLWNNNKTLIVNYNSSWRYTIVIMPSAGGAVNVEADRKVIMEAYKASLKTQAEKPE